MATLPIKERGSCAMSELTDAKTRADMLNRLKRAEGQLRGIQRMIEEGQGCRDIATQMAAVRKALDSAYVHMTVCFMQQELEACLGSGADGETGERIGGVLSDVQELLGKLR
jgi:DNA-binding FrmR family transcriptional regulator